MRTLVVSLHLLQLERNPIEEFVAAGDFLTYKFPVWTWYALSDNCSVTIH